jgi:DNA-binding CsgD family transcriptional regulator
MGLLTHFKFIQIPYFTLFYFFVRLYVVNFTSYTVTINAGYKRKMGAQMENNLSRLLLEIHRGGRTIEPGRFQDWALQQIKIHIPFDAAMWSYGVAQEHAGHKHKAHVYNLLHSLHDEILQLREYEMLRQQTLQPKENHIVCSSAVFHLEADSPLKRCNIEYLLCTLILDPFTHLITTVALCRLGSWPFSQEEQELCQALMPHVVDIYDNTRLEYLMLQREADSRIYAPALVDEDGMLHITDKRFPQLLLEEWPTWSGPYLPQELKQWLNGESQISYTGHMMVAHVTLADEQILLRARKKYPYDNLGKREHEVAELFARGLSYKEIAKAMDISPSTVGNHLYTVYAKLGINNKLELAKMVNEMR